jgi:hypothetical protein
MKSLSVGLSSIAIGMVLIVYAPFAHAQIPNADSVPSRLAVPKPSVGSNPRRDSSGVTKGGAAKNSGVSGNRATGAADGTGLSSDSPQTYWAEHVSVPSTTGTSLQIFNKLVSSTSTIILTPVGANVGAGQILISSQSAGTFTVSATGPMGTGTGGTLQALNYMVFNH